TSLEHVHSAIAQPAEAIQQPRQGRHTMRDTQLDRQACHARALNEPPQLVVAGLGGSTDLLALQLHFERATRETHGEHRSLLARKRLKPLRQLIEEALLVGRFVQRIKARLAHEPLGNKMHPCLLKREQSVSWHDLVATALESATRVFEHGEQRLMQLQLEMQDARRRSLETAGCQTRIDQPSNRNAGLIDDAEEEAE